MSKLTKEECIARGIPWHDIRHRKTRRAFWRDYWRAGEYGITIHLHEMEDGGIFYSALEQGYHCIKLVKDVIPEKGHPVSMDRGYCAMGQLLVLGPWGIKDTNDYASLFGDAESKYAKFHNLNEMAAELCKENLSMTIDRKTLEEC